MTNEPTTTGANYLPTVDENGKPMIDPTYYKNIIQDRITAYMQETGTDRNHIDGNDLLAVYRETQQTIFKPPYTPQSNNRCNIPYTPHNIDALFKVYINISTAYKVPPSLFAFSILTGIDEGTTEKYLTLAGFEISNIRREMLRNKLYSDRTGSIVLANNDTSFGLEYEKKNTVERETIKRGLSLQELPQLGGHTVDN